MKRKASLTFLLYFTFVFSISLLFGCSNNFDRYNYQHTFTSVGYAPIAAQKGDTFDLQLLNAIKASKLEAYKEMAEQIHGVLLNAENNVNDSRLLEDQIDSRVKGLVRGARVLKSYHEGDVYITELELNMQSLPFLRAPELQESTRVIPVKRQIYY